MKNHYNIIKGPVITEKCSSLRGAQNKYVFDVNVNANKIEIKQAIEEIFKVKVLDVNTVTVHGKSKRLGVYKGYRSDRKKAIVRLKEGDTIKLFEGV